MRTGDCFRGEAGIVMDNYTIGDLTDVVRASRGCPNSTSPEVPVSITNNAWQFPMSHNSNSSNTDDSASIIPPFSSMDDSFGDPFSDMRDPLLQGLDSVFLNSNSSSMGSPADMIDVVCGDDVFVPNMFTRMLHMSAADNNPSHNHLPVSLSCESPVTAASPVMKEIKINNISPSLADMNLNKSKSCLMDSTTMQISSPSNSGIKRRKSQAKKVVCIPAPMAANSRSSGEVVPSDLWAWRKYGQKPIKGSPYPRGYYRCSSSKGCPARKQVERSRTDPNMLVITYTSEHNHPWPTQRNALAGSTRSQPLKDSNSNSVNTSKGSDSQAQNEATAIPKEQETDNGASNTTASIKVEIEDYERTMEINGGREFSMVLSSQFYRTSDPGEANHTEDFFADLGEIDGDPLHLLLDQGFDGDGTKGFKGSDHFAVFDWPEERNLQFGVK